MSKTNTPPCPENDDGHKKRPHAFLESDLKALTQTVQRRLSEDEPEIRERNDTQIAHITEEDTRKFGRSDAEGNATIATWQADAESTSSKCDSSRKHLAGGIRQREDRIKGMPDKVKIFATGLWIGDVGAGLLQWSRYLAVIGVSLAAFFACGVLLYEWTANTGVMQSTGWDFTAKRQDAIAQSFALTIGVFLIFTFWSAAEKHEWHATTRSVLQQGKVLVDWLFPVLGIGLGSQMLDDGQAIGWPMLIVPFSMQVLVRGAFGLESWLLTVASLAVPPTVEKENQKKKSLMVELSEWQRILEKVEELATLAERLRTRANRIIDAHEFVTVSRWRGLQKIQNEIDESRQANLNLVIAMAKKKWFDKP